MFLSMNWICDHVDLSGLDKLDLIHRFSLSTAEVENEIFFKGSQLSGIVAARILTVEPHPQSKKLHLLTVDAGQSEPVSVVCGAPNVRVGMLTAFAPVGAKIGEITISPRALAGETSYGMCCSEAELGISDDHSGIMEITDEIPCGTDLKTVYEIDDIVFEVDNKSLTNRPDLWGHYGIAREFSALAGRPLKAMPVEDLSVFDDLPCVDLKVEDTLCRRYSSLKVENITRSVSPVNMRIRLYYCGMRAINFLADLTNYLMLEMGQPMHAFDSRKVEHLRIKRFDHPFTFRTLDGVDRMIDENTLMICTDDTPVAIAGIMGGLDSGIVDDTTTLTLESANFDAASIRKSTVRLSHRTDASMRYEKSLDPEMTFPAIGRFLYLLKQYDSSCRVVSSLTDAYPAPFPPVTLRFDQAFVDKYTGISIGRDTIVKTLLSLGFAVSAEDDTFTVDVPSWRITKDVTMKADIIEEITRIYGYDNFDIHTAMAPLYPVRTETIKSDEEKMKDILVRSFALHEVHSYVWAYSDEQKALGMAVEENVRLANATNPNIETLRRSMIPTQLCQVKTNASFAPDFGIFEIGRVVHGLKEDGLCDEHKMLGITLFSRSCDVKTLFLRLRDMLSLLAGDIKNSSLRFVAGKAAHDYEHPVNLNTVFLGTQEIGRMGIVHPTVGKAIDKKAAIVFAEIDVQAFSACGKKPLCYEEPSRYPSMEYDLSMNLPGNTLFCDLKECWAQEEEGLLKRVSVIDTYDTELIHKMTVRFVFSSPDRTLSSAEVQEIVNGIMARLSEKGVSIRMS